MPIGLTCRKACLGLVCRIESGMLARKIKIYLFGVL